MPACSIRHSSLWDYVEQERELVHLNTTSGYGNFHMKPNGVFYVSGDRAAVVETRAFLKHRPQADLATQSGPMLVLNWPSPSYASIISKWAMSLPTARICRWVRRTEENYPAASPAISCVCAADKPTFATA